MGKYEDDGEYKCLCDICKKDITNDSYTFETDCTHSLCKEHNKLARELAYRIVEGLQYYHEEKTT